MINIDISIIQEDGTAITVNTSQIDEAPQLHIS